MERFVEQMDIKLRVRE